MEGEGTGWNFPLVDRGLQRPHFSIIAEVDGADKANQKGGPNWKPHTAAELKAEAARLLKKAKALRAKKKKGNKKKLKKLRESLGVFDSRDAGFVDEFTKLKRVSARMNRLLEQIQTPHNTDTFEGGIERKKYFLKMYKQLKADAVKVIQSFALRTGHSIFEIYGDGEVDPSIAAFLPPNSVSAILAQYANPTRGRTDETPRDIISGRDAKRIQYAIDYYHAKKAGKKLPMPPEFAPSSEDLRQQALRNNKAYNEVVATQQGEFGQNRAAVTTGDKALGRTSVHISVVNPTETQKTRGLPFKVDLQNPE